LVVKGYGFNPGDRVLLTFYAGPHENALHILFSRTVYAKLPSLVFTFGEVYDTESESILPQCDITWVQAYDYHTRLYSNLAFAPNEYCIP
jgi:hypothetical protein